jgi:hypothetical protein
MLPQKFSEQYVRLYGTDIDSDMKKEIAKEYFDKWSDKYKTNTDNRPVVVAIFLVAAALLKYLIIK